MQILRMPAVKGRSGHRSDASIYNAIRDGLFPIGVSIGQRAKGWPDYEVDAIITARIAGKSDAEIRELVKLLHTKRTELTLLHKVTA
jgi:prophage regulatory protein